MPPTIVLSWRRSRRCRRSSPRPGRSPAPPLIASGRAPSVAARTPTARTCRQSAQRPRLARRRGPAAAQALRRGLDVGYVAAFACGSLEAMAFGAPTGPFGFIYRRTGIRSPGSTPSGRRRLSGVSHRRRAASRIRPTDDRGAISRPGSVEGLARAEASGSVGRQSDGRDRRGQVGGLAGERGARRGARRESFVRATPTPRRSMRSTGRGRQQARLGPYAVARNTAAD